MRPLQGPIPQLTQLTAFQALLLQYRPWIFYHHARRFVKSAESCPRSWIPLLVTGSTSSWLTLIDRPASTTTPAHCLSACRLCHYLGFVLRYISLQMDRCPLFPLIYCRHGGSASSLNRFMASLRFTVSLAIRLADPVLLLSAFAPCQVPRAKLRLCYGH